MVYRIDRVSMLEPVFRLMQNCAPIKSQSPTMQRINSDNAVNRRVGMTPPMSPKPLSEKHEKIEILQAVEQVLEKEVEEDAPKANEEEKEKKYYSQDTVKEKEIFDFAKGQHDSALLPTCSSFFTELAKEATIEENENEDSSKKWFAYSNEDGDIEIRSEIAKYFSQKYGLTSPITPENLYITSGTTQALHLTLTFLNRQFNKINNIMGEDELRKNNWKYESSDYDENTVQEVEITIEGDAEEIVFNMDEKMKKSNNTIDKKIRINNNININSDNNNNDDDEVENHLQNNVNEMENNLQNNLQNNVNNNNINNNIHNNNLFENKKRKVILCEELTYHQAIKVINEEGFEIEGFETDANGLNIEKLKYQFENNLREIPFAIYIIPTFHNPTSHSLSLYRKILLLQLAHHYQFYIISDDTYQFLSFASPSFIPLKILDHFQLSLKAFVDRNYHVVDQLHRIENLSHSRVPHIQLSPRNQNLLNINNNNNNNNNNNKNNNNNNKRVHNINRESLNIDSNINLINQYLNEEPSPLLSNNNNTNNNNNNTNNNNNNNTKVMKEESAKLSLPLISLELYLLQRDHIDENDGKVISLNSFSKILFPGFQLAFIYSNPFLISHIGNMGSEFDLSSVPFVSRLLMGCIRSGILEKTMERYQSSYLHRCKVMCDCLDLLIQTLEISHEISMTFTRPKGGFFVWLTVNKPSDFDADDFLTFCTTHPIEQFPLIHYTVAEDRNIIHNDIYSNDDDHTEKYLMFESGSKFCCKRNAMRNSLRLSFAPLSPKKIHEGISLLLALFYRFFTSSSD